MNSLFYNVCDRTLTDASGSPTAHVPELFYQQYAEWQIFLRSDQNSAADISGIAAWGAAVAGDFCSGTPPMCRTLSEKISVDAAAGYVTVALDCATPEFLAAVNGSGVKPAWFELYGLDTSGRRIINVCFEIRARMSIDPDPLVDTATPDTVATKAYTSAAIVAAAEAAEAYTDRKIESGGYVNSSGAATVASNAAVVTMLSGGQAAIGGASAIELWFESGFRENCFADLAMSSKSLTLVSSGGSFVYRPENYIWVSTFIDGYGDISNTLNASDSTAGFFATSSGGEIVISAIGVTEAFLQGPTDSTVVDGLIASSTDGGNTWTVGNAGIYWGTNGEEVEEEGQGQGYCYPQWGLGRCCKVEMLSPTVSASGALLSNTKIDTVLGNYRLTYTSNGGLAISGGGVLLQVSSGGIVASADNGDDGANVGTVLSMTSNGGVSVSAYDHESPYDPVCCVEISTEGIVASGASGERVVLSGGEIRAQVYNEDSDEQASVFIASGGVAFNASDLTNDVGLAAMPGEVHVTGNHDGTAGALLHLNSRPVATEPVIVIDSETTSAVIEVLSGGTSFVYTQPLTSLSVASVASSTQESWLEFTVASGGSVSINDINDSGYKWLGGRPSVFEGGSSYAVGFRWGRQAVCSPLEE